jgi:S-adenosylmethionine synthetase
MGREPQVVKKVFESPYNGKTEIEVELFPWEKLDAVEDIQQTFNIIN